jgi:hypothetical protein
VAGCDFRRRARTHARQVQSGETIEFELPEPLKAKLPPDLQQHDYALRVTTERLW